MQRIFLLIAILASFGVSNSLALAKEPVVVEPHENIMTARYLLGTAEEYKREKGDCSTALGFSILKDKYVDAIESLDPHIAKNPTHSDAYKLKAVASYWLSDCYTQRNSKPAALAQMEEAAWTVSALLDIFPDDVMSQRELVMIESEIGLRALEIFQKEKAVAAYKRAIKLSETLIEKQPFTYSDHKDLIGNYLLLMTLNDDPAITFKYAARAVCVSQNAIVSGKVPPEEVERIQANVLFNIVQASSQNEASRDGQILTCPPI